jgi:hypothetical protein
VLRRKDMLRMGMKPLCVFDVTDADESRVDTPHDVQIPQYPILMISTMTNILSSEFKSAHGEGSGAGTRPGRRELADKRRELAMFTFDAARAYAEMYRVKARMTAYADQLGVNVRKTLEKDLSNIHKHMNEAADSSLKFWEESGQVFTGE